MKVFIIAGDYEEDGFGEPEGAYSTLELAQAAQSRLSEYYIYARKIFELELDELDESAKL